MAFPGLIGTGAATVHGYRVAVFPRPGEIEPSLEEIRLKMPMIDASRIESMLAQIRAAQAHTAGAAAGTVAPKASEAVAKPGFADALKASLDQVNNIEQATGKAQERFALGDDKVSLSDVMISMQKADISFQATIQVRNRLVSAYQDIMNMPV